MESINSGSPRGPHKTETNMGICRNATVTPKFWSKTEFFRPLLLAFAVLLGLLNSLSATAGSLSKADIERRFGPPLHVQEKLTESPAWPLTHEIEGNGAPVGYVFESIDLAPIPGFEGTPMNFLVSIDKKGNFMDVELLHQHEPVFLGGLGEAPLREFVRQYAGKPLSRQFVIARGYGQRGADGQEGGGRVVLDGVSKATASIRIV